MLAAMSGHPAATTLFSSPRCGAVENSEYTKDFEMFSAAATAASRRTTASSDGSRGPTPRNNVSMQLLNLARNSAGGFTTSNPLSSNPTPRSQNPTPRSQIPTPRSLNITPRSGLSLTGSATGTPRQPSLPTATGMAWAPAAAAGGGAAVLSAALVAGLPPPTVVHPLPQPPAMYVDPGNDDPLVSERSGSPSGADGRKYKVQKSELGPNITPGRSEDTRPRVPSLGLSKLGKY